MGLFNVLTGSAACPSCGRVGTVRAQFKYGHTRQLEYRMGQTLQWSGDYQRVPPRRMNDVGVPGRRYVVVDAIAETDCSSCGYGPSPDEWNLYVFLQGDRIVKLETADGSYDFLNAGQTFIVLED